MTTIARTTVQDNLLRIGSLRPGLENNSLFDQYPLNRNTEGKGKE